MTPAALAIIERNAAPQAPFDLPLPPPALTLASLSAEAWTPIAYSRVNRGGYAMWDYSIGNVSALNLARDRGAVITGQRRQMDGTFVLLARLARGMGR